MNTLRYYSFILSFLFLKLQSYAQDGSISGKWILDRVVYKDGRRLEINNPQYSIGMVYIIGSGFVKMGDQKFDAVIRGGKIQTPYVTFNFQMENEYLAVYEERGDKVSFLLRPVDFIKKYPEFAPVRVMAGSDSLTVANELTDYEFVNDLSLDAFIRNRMTDRPSKSFKNLYFKATFVLTKSNKVTDLRVLNSISEAYDNEYLNALKAAEPFFSNHTGTDLLITREAHHLMLYKYLKDPEEKKLYEILDTADEYYYQNQFEKAVETYSKIEKLAIKNNRYKIRIKEAMIRLGISYLALGNQQQACRTFQSVGDRTDFQLRHYINDFCSPVQASR